MVRIASIFSALRLGSIYLYPIGSLSTFGEHGHSEAPVRRKRPTVALLQVPPQYSIMVKGGRPTTLTS